MAGCLGPGKALAAQASPRQGRASQPAQLTSSPASPSLPRQRAQPASATSHDRGQDGKGPRKNPGKKPGSSRPGQRPGWGPEWKPRQTRAETERLSIVNCAQMHIIICIICLCLGTDMPDSAGQCLMHVNNLHQLHLASLGSCLSRVCPEGAGEYMFGVKLCQ